MAVGVAREAVGAGVVSRSWGSCRWAPPDGGWGELELGWDLGHELHLHHKRGHVHNHGCVLRTCEVSIARLELGIQRRDRVDLRASALLLRWAARPGLLSARGGGLGCGLFVWAVFGRTAVLVGTTRANVAHLGLADQSSPAVLGPGPQLRRTGPAKVAIGVAQAAGATPGPC